MSQTVSPTIEYSWKKVLLWAFMFYLVWNWKSMALVYSEGVLPGPDDFMRLHQVENWLAGQGWYDLTAYRMSPVLGADIHWSRLVDIPIAGLITFFKLLTDPVIASRLAAILWPVVLFMIAITAMIATCDRLAGKENRLLALFFFVLSINTMAEFRPGRLDHHNVQIVLLILMMLGLAKGLGKYSNYWVGFLMTLSVVIGLDSVILIMAALGSLALGWALGKNNASKRLQETGLAIGVSSLCLYALSTAPSHWLQNNACDGYSSVYVSALVLLGAAFVTLASLSNISLLNGQKAFIKRIAFGGIIAGIVVFVVFLAFPHCLEGPLGNVSPELKSRWLDKVTEAKGIFERMQIKPAYWITQAIYLSLALLVTLFVLLKHKAQTHVTAILGFIVLICILGAIYQTRILRTGIYSVIPFCVIFASMSWSWLSKKFPTQNIVNYAAQAVICLALTSTFWFIIGLSAGNLQAKPETTATLKNDKNNDQIELPLECTSEFAMKDLLGIKPTHIISDLNTSTAILVHTPHSVEAGSYHRNSKSILNVISFFEGKVDQSQKIAQDTKADFVVICREDIPSGVGLDDLTLAVAIGQNKLPNWLKWFSEPDAPLAILKVVK